MKKHLAEALQEIRRDGEINCEDCVEKRRNRIAGQAFTSYVCKRCNRSDMHHNTATPNLCRDCAFAGFKCQRCMESLEKDLV